MINTAVKIALKETEFVWGEKIDDWMICLTNEDALQYKKEFNRNESNDFVPPQWHMFIDGEPLPIELTEKQMNYLKEKKRVYLSTLNRLI